MATLLWPVFTFRPIITRPGELFRFAGGAWIADDGEPDLAFFGESIAYRIDLPHRENIVWSWLDGHWSAAEHRHPRSNPWHYSLRPGETQWGAPWARHAHPNVIAGDQAMRRCAAKYRVANGGGPEINKDGPYHARGLIRLQETGEVYRRPAVLPCMFCGDRAPTLRCEAA